MIAGIVARPASLRRPPAPLAHDQLVAVARVTHDDRLQHADLADRADQLVQRVLVEHGPRLPRVRPDRPDGQLGEPRTRNRHQAVVVGSAAARVEPAVRAAPQRACSDAVDVGRSVGARLRSACRSLPAAGAGGRSHRRPAAPRLSGRRRPRAPAGALPPRPLLPLRVAEEDVRRGARLRSVAGRPGRSG